MFKKNSPSNTKISQNSNEEKSEHKPIENDLINQKKKEKIQDLSMEECSQSIKKVTGNSFEPYRVYLRPLRNKMRITHTHIEQHLNHNKPLDQKKLLSNREEILKPLRVVRESL